MSRPSEPRLAGSDRMESGSGFREAARRPAWSGGGRSGEEQAGGMSPGRGVVHPWSDAETGRLMCRSEKVKWCA